MNTFLRNIVLFLAALGLGVCAAYFALRDGPKADRAPEPTPSVGAECRWASKPIVLDGVDDDEPWRFAQVIENFGQTWLGEKAPILRGKTRAKLLWDDEFLYFYAEMTDIDLFADVTKHDGAIWENDTFELFFRPHEDKPGYFEFEVNAQNAVLDAYFPKRDLSTAINHIVNGEFHVETKVKLRGTLNQRKDADDGWSVEGRIPWRDFVQCTKRPTPGDQWRFNLCRCNYDIGHEVELTATAPFKEKLIGSFFHQIEEYPAITFMGPAVK